MRKILRSKIHRATVTQADLHYEGSLTIPPALLQATDIRSYEAISVWNVTRGTRLETYAIEGDDSQSICVNGAAAHLVTVGDLIIIAAFKDIPESSLAMHRPRLVFVDEKNQIAHEGPEVPGPQVRSANGSVSAPK